MVTITQRIQPRRRPQIFNDYADIDAMLADEQDDLDRWLKYIADDLAGAVRKIARITRRNWRLFRWSYGESVRQRLAGHPA
jgi:hypothetical protein